MWTVNVDKSVDKKLKKIPNQDKQLDIKPLVGREGYRLKVGGWRLLMDINEDERVIFIYTLASRGDVYKK